MCFVYFLLLLLLSRSSVSGEGVYLVKMHLWCVLFVLPVLVAESLSPGDGCGLNTTVVAGVAPPTAEFQYSTSIVNTGEGERRGREFFHDIVELKAVCRCGR